MLRSLQSVSAVLSKHEADLKDLQVNVAALQQHVDALLSALDDEFDIPRLCAAAKNVLGQCLRWPCWRRNFKKWSVVVVTIRLRSELQAKLDVERSMKCGVRMRAIWCVRAGLSPAHIPQRPIAEFLSQ